MQVQVKDALTCTGTGVDHHPKTIRRPLLASNLRRCQHQPPQNDGVFAVRHSQAVYVPTGDQQNVGRRLGMDITKSNDFFILKHNLRRGCARGNSAERAVPNRLCSARIGLRFRHPAQIHSDCACALENPSFIPYPDHATGDRQTGCSQLFTHPSTMRATWQSTRVDQSTY